MVLKVILKLIYENGWLSHTYLLLLKKTKKNFNDTKNPQKYVVFQFSAIF